MSGGEPVNRLSADTEAALRAADAVEVLRLFPGLGPVGRGDPPPRRPLFRGWPVLGTPAVAGATERAEVVEALVRGVEEDQGLRPGWRRACGHAEEVGLWFTFKICAGCGKGWRIVRPPVPDAKSEPE